MKKTLLFLVIFAGVSFAVADGDSKNVDRDSSDTNSTSKIEHKVKKRHHINVEDMKHMTPEQMRERLKDRNVTFIGEG